MMIRQQVRAVKLFVICLVAVDLSVILRHQVVQSVTIKEIRIRCFGITIAVNMKSRVKACLGKALVIEIWLTAWTRWGDRWQVAQAALGGELEVLLVVR